MRSKGHHTIHSQALREDGWMDPAREANLASRVILSITCALHETTNELQAFAPRTRWTGILFIGLYAPEDCPSSEFVADRG